MTITVTHDQAGAITGLTINATTYSPAALELLVTRVGELEGELANALTESTHNAVIASLNYQEAVHFREQRDAALAEVARLRIRLAQRPNIPI